MAASDGRMAGNARRNLEKELGKAIVSPQNFLNTAKIDVLPSEI